MHGLGGAKDLPIPLGLAVAGGIASLVVSFCVLALAWQAPRYQDPSGNCGEFPVARNRCPPGYAGSALPSSHPFGLGMK